jgi:hypothetical protein
MMAGGVLAGQRRPPALGCPLAGAPCRPVCTHLARTHGRQASRDVRVIARERSACCTSIQTMLAPGDCGRVGAAARRLIEIPTEPLIEMLAGTPREPAESRRPACPQGPETGSPKHNH